MGFGSTAAMRSVLLAASAEAYRRGQFVEPSHLLLAMVRLPDNGARRWIQRLAADRDLEADLVRLVSEEPVQADGIPAKKVPMSAVTKTAFELSIKDVISRDHRWTTLDVLRGILRHGSSPTAQLLNDYGLTLGAAENLIANPEFSEE